jgi:hypothetical protein
MSTTEIIIFDEYIFEVYISQWDYSSTSLINNYFNG